MGSQNQLEQWRTLQSLYMADQLAIKSRQNLNLQRQIAMPEASRLLFSFLNQKISFELFHSILQLKAVSAWRVLGLRGMSSSMFLCRLVNCVCDLASVTEYLQTYLPVPDDSSVILGQVKMQQFISLLEDFISAGLISRYYIQPARVPFFLSVWWHIQSPEIWPVFYPSARPLFITKAEMALEDLVKQYFIFHRRFTSVAEELGISLWELEHICAWYEQHKGEISYPCYQITELPYEAINLCRGKTRVETIQPNCENGINKTASKNVSSAVKSKKNISRHAHLQWLIAKIGLKVGYQVWVSADDHDTVWNGERLGDLSLKSLPFSGDMTIEQNINKIDVLWLHKNEIVAAYEIEHDKKGDITTGLLRLSDLAACFPRRNIQLCTVAPREQLERIKSELPRPAFQRIKNLALLCEDALIKQHEHILRWANSPSIIQDLISHVGEESRPVTNALA